MPGLRGRGLRDCLLPVAPALAAAILISAAGYSGSGFVSDDFDLVRSAERFEVFDRVEPYHFSPLRNAMYELTAAGLLTPGGWSLIRLAAHLANTLLLYLLLARGFGLRRLVAGFAALLFSANPCGYEALGWSACVGYLLVTPVLFVILGACLRLDPPPRRTMPLPLALFLLQMLAVLAWDWGLLATPFVIAVEWLLLLPAGRTTRREALTASVAVSSAALLYVVLRTMLGYSAGAGWFIGDFTQLFKYAVRAPMFCLFPDAPLGILKSVPAYAANALLIVILALGCWKSRLVLLLISLFMICQIPYMLVGGSMQSRYLYLPAAFLYAAVSILIGGIPSRTARVSALALTACVTLIWGFQRSIQWAEAWEQSDAIRQQIESIPLEPGRQLVILNLPDTWGPASLAFNPFMWRNGYGTAFERSFEFYNTDDCTRPWTGGTVPVVGRSMVDSVFADAVVWEVVPDDPVERRTFRVVPFGVSR